MGDIYGTAKQVLVWLGPDDENQAGKIFDGISTIVDDLMVLIDYGLFEPESAYPSPLAESQLRQITPLFKSDWFTRTWTIQEAGLTEMPVAVWGRHRVDFNKICLVCMLYLKCFRSEAEKLGVVGELEMISNLYRMYLPTAGVKRLHYVLHEGRAFKANDPRDKVYAFMSHPAAFDDSSDHAGLRNGENLPETLGRNIIRMRNLALILTPGPPLKNNDIQFGLLMTGDFNHEPRPPSPDFLSARRLLQMESPQWKSLRRYYPGCKSFITPDYNHSLVTVYRDLAVKIIERFNSLEIFSFVQHEAPLPLTGPDFPSWVPRWDIFSDLSLIGKVTCDHFAAANRRPIIIPSSDPNELVVRGIFCDRVWWHTRTLTRQDFLSPSTSSPVFSIAPRCLVHKDPVPKYPRLINTIMGDPDRIRAYQKTWTAGYSSVPYGLDPDFLAYQEEFLRKKLPNLTTPETLMLLSTAEMRGGRGDARRFANAAAEACHGRRFFITEAGFFGIGPGILEEKDMVAVVLGHDVPVVLREKSKLRRHADGYVLLGDCYVHGIMSGEVLRSHGREEMRDFKLG